MAVWNSMKRATIPFYLKVQKGGQEGQSNNKVRDEESIDRDADGAGVGLVKHGSEVPIEESRPPSATDFKEEDSQKIYKGDVPSSEDRQEPDDTGKRHASCPETFSKKQKHNSMLSFEEEA